ncbi:MAG: amidohydrolase family protein [Saprospiraceae bacterium]
MQVPKQQITRNAERSKCAFACTINRHYYFIFLILLFLQTAEAQKVGPENPYVVIKNINIIDVIAGKIRYHQKVVIKGSKIYYTGKSFKGRLPKGTPHFNGRGKFLSPGLWDMHVHICWDRHNDSLLFNVLLDHGITGIRDMGGDLNIMQEFKEEIKNGDIAGPEIYGAGPIIDGNPPVYKDFTIPVDNQTEVIPILDSLRLKGVDFFKTYSLIKEKQINQIASYCKKNNFSFAGHLSEYIEPEISIDYGQKSIEHLNRLEEIWHNNKIRSDQIAKLMIEHKTFLCPTLIIYQLKTKIRDSTIINKSFEKYIPQSLKNEWEMVWKKRQNKRSAPEDLEKLTEEYYAQRELIKRYKSLGVKMMAGSDFAGMPYVYPGISLHQELKLLVDCGFTTAEALRTATINPAIFMKKEKQYGTVVPGKFADLVIFSENPLKKIENIDRIEAVILKGKLRKVSR